MSIRSSRFRRNRHNTRGDAEGAPQAPPAPEPQAAAQQPSFGERLRKKVKDALEGSPAPASPAPEPEGAPAPEKRTREQVTDDEFSEKLKEESLGKRRRHAPRKPQYDPDEEARRKFQEEMANRKSPEEMEEGRRQEAEQEVRRRMNTPPYPTEDDQQNLRKRLGGDEETGEPQQESRAERRERRRKEREQRSQEAQQETAEHSGETRKERRERRRREREQAQQAPAAAPGDEGLLNKIGKEVAAGAKQVYGEVKPALGRVQHGLDEVAGNTGGTSVKKLAAASRDAKYRVDPSTGHLYAEDRNGVWYDTGMQTKYEIPKTVIDSVTGFKTSVYDNEPSLREEMDVRGGLIGGHIRRPGESSTASRGWGGADEGESLFSGSIFGKSKKGGRYHDTFDDRSDEGESLFSSNILGSSKKAPWEEEDNRGSLFSGNLFGGSGRGRDRFDDRGRFEEKKSFGAGMNYMSSGMGYKMYDEQKVRERELRDQQRGSVLRVSSGTISAQKMSGWDEAKEQQKMAEMNQRGSPLGAGLNYLSAGTFSTVSGKGGNGQKFLGTITSGSFWGLGYGAKKLAAQPQTSQSAQMPEGMPVEEAPPKMSRAERKAMNKQRYAAMKSGGQASAMQVPVEQVPVEMEPPVPQEPPQKQKSAVEVLFGGMSRSGGARPAEHPLRSNAVNNFFGMTTKPRSPAQQPPVTQPQKPKSATEVLFGRRT